MTGLKLFVVHQTRERARFLRQHAQERRRQAQAVKARARGLLARVGELRYPPDDARAEIQAIEPMIRPLTQLPLRESFEANRQQLLAGLQQSLRDLETLRMTPADDPVVCELTADIRKTIAQAAASPTLNQPRRSRSFVRGAHREY